MTKRIRCRSKAIQQIEFVRQLKSEDNINANVIQSMFTLTISGKIKEMRLKFSQGSVTVS